MRSKEALIDYARQCDVPEHDIGGLVDYVLEHVPTGGFLRRLLCNDLFGAVGKADKDNRLALPQICQFIYNAFPPGSFGSAELYEEWIAKRVVAIPEVKE